MSQYYYLMAQLPSLDGLGDCAPLPITEEVFLENCSRFLDEKAMSTLRQMTLKPPLEAQSTGSPLVDAWHRGERELRLALGIARASNMKKSFDPGGEVPNAVAVQAARSAVELGDPMAAELFLQQYRMSFLESLRPLDGYGEEAVFYYGLKLKLLERMGLFDEERGKEAYRNIYDAILHGEDRENER